jgi:hypothetical protein
VTLVACWGSSYWGVQGLGVIGFGVLADSWETEERQAAGGIPVDPAQRGGDLGVTGQSVAALPHRHAPAPAMLRWLLVGG